MEMKFAGELVSFTANIPVRPLPNGGWEPPFGAFFPGTFEAIHSELPDGVGGGGAVFSNETVLLGLFESDPKIIQANLREPTIDLFVEHRLIDTRHGLVMCILWTFARGRPQVSTAEHFLNMHSEGAISILRKLGKQETLPVAYCDLNTQKVVRFIGVPGNITSNAGVLADMAEELVDSGETYAEEFNMQEAVAEAMAHLDNSSTPAIQPEKTY